MKKAQLIFGILVAVLITAMTTSCGTTVVIQGVEVAKPEPQPSKPRPEGGQGVKVKIPPMKSNPQPKPLIIGTAVLGVTLVEHFKEKKQ